MIWDAKRRRCTRCGSKRLRQVSASPEAITNRLTRGQRREQELGSIRYVLMECADCSHVMVVGKETWFSNYSRCPRCRHKTLRTTETVLRRATGTEEIHEACEFCGYERTSVEIIPMLSDSSDRDWDRDSRSSGGSSSGGGASGRW